MGGAGNGKLGAARRGRGMGTWDGHGGCGGPRGSRGAGGGGWGWGMRIGGAGNGKGGAVGGVWGTRTWDGGGACGGSPGSGGLGGGGWGWGTRISGAGNGKRGAVCGGRGTGTWDGCGVRVGARGSGSGGSGALGGCGGASGSRSGASERVRRRGAVGSVRAGGGCAARGGSGSAVVVGTGPRCEASPASQEASAGPGAPRVVLPGTGGGVSPPPSVDLPRRGAAAVAAGGTGRVAVLDGLGLGGPFGVDVVARRIRFLVWGRQPLVVGGVVGWSARWVVLPSHALLLVVHGGCGPVG